MAVLIPEITGLSAAQLLRLYAQILARLRVTGIVRSANAPAGDLAERLVLEWKYLDELTVRDIADRL